MGLKKEAIVFRTGHPVDICIDRRWDLKDRKAVKVVVIIQY